MDKLMSRHMKSAADNAYCVSCGWTGDRDELVPITVREDGGLKPDCKCPRCGAEGYGYKVFIEEDDDE